MPFDGGIDKIEEDDESNFLEKRRIYVGEDGGIRVETRHFRRTFAPEEFVALLRKIAFNKNHRTNRRLPILNPANVNKNGCVLFLTIICLLFFSGCAANSSTSRTNNPTRIVSVGGAVTETVYALGQESKLVGADTSSIFPKAATELPPVGYQRTLSAEGVLSLKPDLVLMAAETGPPAAVSQIESAGIKTVKIGGENSIDGARTKIREIAKAVNAEAKGEELIKNLDADLIEAKQCTDALAVKPKILFIYARGSGAPNVAGAKTAADAMISLAGGQNAVVGFENYKPLTPEALVAAQPDFILMPTLGLESLGGADGLLKIPGVTETPAGKNHRFITVDDLVLLGFGPRTGAGVKELCEKIQ